MFIVPTELRPSSIHGIGVFLSVPVTRGQVIWRFDSRIDRIFTDAELANLPEHIQKFVKVYSCWNHATNTWMLCGDNGRFVNHSETPTLHAVGVKSLGDDVAAEDLKTGMELTSDYREICDLTLDDYMYCNAKIAA